LLQIGDNIMQKKTVDKEWDRIPVKPEIGDVIREISREEGRFSYAVVANALKTAYPEYFKVKA